MLTCSHIMSFVVLEDNNHQTAFAAMMSHKDYGPHLSANSNFFFQNPGCAGTTSTSFPLVYTY